MRLACKRVATHMFGALAFPSLLAPEHTQGSLCITVRKDVAKGSLIIVNYLSPPPVICLLFVPVTAEPVAQLVGGSAAGHHATTWVFHGKRTGFCACCQSGTSGGSLVVRERPNDG